MPQRNQNPGYNPLLAPYDLTRGGNFYAFTGRTDVKELALYIEDMIKAGNWIFNVGIRGICTTVLPSPGKRSQCRRRV